MQSLSKKDGPTDLSIESSRHQQPSISPTPSYVSSSSSSTSSKTQEPSKSFKKSAKLPIFPNSNNNLQFNNNLLDLNSLILKNQDMQSQANNQNISSFLNLIKSVFPQQQQQAISNNPFPALYANPTLQFASLLSNPLFANCLNSQMPINESKSLSNNSDLPFSGSTSSNNNDNIDDNDNTQPINLSNKKSQSPHSHGDYEISDAPLDLSSRKSTSKPQIDMNILKSQFNESEQSINLKKIFDQNLKLTEPNNLFTKSLMKKSLHKNNAQQQQQISPGSVSNSSSTSPSASNSSCSSLSSYSFENNIKSNSPNDHAKPNDGEKKHKSFSVKSEPNDSLKNFEKNGKIFNPLVFKIFKLLLMN